VRKWKEYAGSTAAEYQDWATKDGASPVATNFRSFGYAARAAALEFDLPPERVPVTPETPWGTVIEQGPDGARRFLAPVDDNRFVYDGSGLGCPHHGWYTHGWYEVERP
jgi:hypothetical protein